VVYSTNGNIQTSDARKKKNIKDLNYGLSQIMALRPVTYQWKSDLMGITPIAPHEKERKLGFVAQEVQNVLPEIVQDKEWLPISEDRPEEYHLVPMQTLGMSYTEMTPVLVKAIQEQQAAIQEQQAAIQEQQAENQELRNMLSQILENQQRFDSDLEQCCLDHEQGSAIPAAGSGLGDDAASLEQNQPNPFSENTVIKYYLPNNTERASMTITDMNGTELKTFTLSGKGYGQVFIGGGSLASGTYIYTLTVNGERVDSKRMMLL
jgi:type II secretory pathway pseudopilin PulG